MRLGLLVLFCAVVIPLAACSQSAPAETSSPLRSSTYPCAHGAARAYTRPNGDVRTRANADGDTCAHPRAYSIACGHTHACSNARADADPSAESHSYSDHHSDPDLCSDYAYAYTDSHAHADYYTHANADPDADTHAHTDSGTIRTLRGHSCTGASRLHVVGVEPGQAVQGGDI